MKNFSLPLQEQDPFKGCNFKRRIVSAKKIRERKIFFHTSTGKNNN